MFGCLFFFLLKEHFIISNANVNVSTAIKGLNEGNGRWMKRSLCWARIEKPLLHSWQDELQVREDIPG